MNSNQGSRIAVDREFVEDKHIFLSTVQWEPEKTATLPKRFVAYRRKLICKYRRSKRLPPVEMRKIHVEKTEIYFFYRKPNVNATMIFPTVGICTVFHKIVLTLKTGEVVRSSE